MHEAARRWGFRWRGMSLLVLVTALAACAGTRNAQDESYVYRSDDDFVRLAPIEPGASPNAHPFALSESQLSRLLAGIEVSGTQPAGKVSVFSQDELEIIVPPLVSALGKARPNQDVIFAVSAHRGLFGRLSPESVTAGRLFARGDSLNLIFGLMHARLDIGDLDYSGVSRRISPGARSRRIGGSVWRVDPGRGRLHEERGDWLVFDRSAIPAAQPAQTAPSTGKRDAASDGEVPAEVEEIENRLRVLEALRERGAITEEEYLERRRAILDQL